MYIFGIVTAKNSEKLLDAITDRINELLTGKGELNIISISHAIDHDYEPALWTALITCERFQEDK